MFPLIRYRTFTTDEYMGIIMMGFAINSLCLSVNNATTAVIDISNQNENASDIIPLHYIDTFCAVWTLLKSYIRLNLISLYYFIK